MNSDHHDRRHQRLRAGLLGTQAEGLLLLLCIGAALPACPSVQQDWGRKDAWRACDGMIDDYPHVPAPACGVLHMCANEAPLDGGQQHKLDEIIAATPGCAPP